MAVKKQYYRPNQNYTQNALPHTFQDLYDTTDALDKGEIDSVLAGVQYTTTKSRNVLGQSNESFSSQDLYAKNSDEFASILGGTAGKSVTEYKKKKTLQSETAAKGLGANASILGGSAF